MSRVVRCLRLRERAHRLLVAASVPALLAAAACPSHGQPAETSHRAPAVPRVSELFGAVAEPPRLRLAFPAGADDAPDTSATPSQGEPFTLRTSVTDTEASDLRTLLARGERWHLVRFDAVALSHRLDTRLTAYGRVAYVPADAGTAVQPSMEDPVSLGLRGELGDFELGAEYRSLGKRLERVVRDGRKDQEGAEIWLGRRLGPVRLRLSQAELSDNVDRNPALPRTTRVQTSLAAELLPPDWPALGLSVATGDLERTPPGAAARDRAPERRGFHSVTASARHDAGWWGAGVSAGYSRTRDPLQDGHDSEALQQDASVWLRFFETLTVATSAGLGQEHYLWSGTTSDTASAWLTVAYAPPRRAWHAWTVAGGTLHATSDRSVDGRSVSFGGGVGWDLGRWGAGRSTLSVEAGYDRYVDAVYPAGSSRSVFGLVLLTIRTN